MNKKELNFILQEGEGLKLEFKESTNNLDKEIAALANSEGGWVKSWGKSWVKIK